MGGACDRRDPDRRSLCSRWNSIEGRYHITYRFFINNIILSPERWRLLFSWRGGWWETLSHHRHLDSCVRFRWSSLMPIDRSFMLHYCLDLEPDNVSILGLPQMMTWRSRLVSQHSNIEMLHTCSLLLKLVSNCLKHAHRRQQAPVKRTKEQRTKYIQRIKSRPSMDII